MHRWARLRVDKVRGHGTFWLPGAEVVRRYGSLAFDIADGTTLTNA